MKNNISAEAQGKHFSELVDRAARNPLRVVSIEDDQEFRSLVAHVLKPGETLGELVSRCGLGKAQILQERMTADQIKAFCELADERRADDVIEQSEGWHRKVTIPAHFTI